MDIRPRNASPILKRNTKPNMPMAIEKPFFLKKLITGPPIVPVIYTTNLVNKFLDPSFDCIMSSVSFCFSCLLVMRGSLINIRPKFIKIITIPKIKKVVCQ